MEFIDLKKQYDLIKNEVNSNINRVFEHGKFIMGPEINELENRLSNYVGTKYAITCSSGTDALLLPLMAKEIGPGDAVITVSFTFVSTAEVISLLGATPVFTDICPKCFNISTKEINASIELARKKGLRPKAIIPVDLFGQPANYDEINKIAKENDMWVLEDLAQAFGASQNNVKTGNFGLVGATSFFPAKPLGCYGDGGAIFTNNDDLAEKIKSIRVHGKGSDKYDNVRIGINGRLDTIQAAILLAKLDIFDSEIKSRNDKALIYNNLLSEVLKTPFVRPSNISAWAQYSVLAKNSNQRSKLQSILKENNIPSAIYYPTPLHLQTAYKYLNQKEGSLPISEDISKRIFSLPMHPYLEKKEISIVSNVIYEALIKN